MGERLFNVNRLNLQKKAIYTLVLTGISAAVLVPQIAVAPFQNPIIESYANTNGELDGRNTHYELGVFGCKLVINKFENFTKDEPLIQTITSTSCELLR